MSFDLEGKMKVFGLDTGDVPGSGVGAVAGRRPSSIFA